MLKRTRRRSAQITLVLLGAAAIAGCGDDDSDQRRDLYASKQDCVQDWGDETKCEVAPPGTTSSRPHSGSGYYWGPAYSGSSYRTGSSTSNSTGWTSARSGSRAVASSSFSRGGFGHSSSSHGSSSS
jgi:uncharacterized protein YgiB involved in biofilm formation